MKTHEVVFNPRAPLLLFWVIKRKRQGVVMLDKVPLAIIVSVEMRLPAEQGALLDAEWPSSRPSKVEKGFHYVVIYIKRPECREIPAACIALRDRVFSGTPGEFRLAVLHGDDVGNHSGVAAVSICERM